MNNYKVLFSALPFMRGEVILENDDLLWSGEIFENSKLCISAGRKIIKFKNVFKKCNM